MSSKIYNSKHNTKSNPLKKRYRIKNWSSYNKSLIQRGDITIWFSDRAIKKWYYSGSRNQGAPIIYSELAIQTILTIRFLFRFPLRRTQGLVTSLLSLMKVALQVPDYSTVCRRQRNLKIQSSIKPYKKDEAINIIIDSTGLKVFGEGEWKVRRHGYTKHRMWRKLHICIEPKTKEIVAHSLTTNSVSDHVEGANLLKSIEQPVASVSADAGYDASDLYSFCKQHNALALIRPRKNARIRDGTIWKSRNENVSCILENGSQHWRLTSGYSQRALVENTVFRYKITFGDKPQAHIIENQRTEAAIKCDILNTFLALGKPCSYQTT